MRRLLPLLLAALLVVLLLPLAAVGGDELAAITARFDHAGHAKAFDRNDVSCVSCHQVGAQGKALAPPPTGTCHQCHVDKPERSLLHSTPSRCDTCHASVAAPDTHVSTWLAWHGSEADSSCTSCHARRDCVDCHEGRLDPTFKVHDPGFLSTHGIEAAAGATCDSCHSQSECLACHAGSPR